MTDGLSVAVVATSNVTESPQCALAVGADAAAELPRRWRLMLDGLLLPARAVEAKARTSAAIDMTSAVRRLTIARLPFPCDGIRPSSRGSRPWASSGSARLRLLGGHRRQPA